jgi:hypothetical protein
MPKYNSIDTIPAKVFFEIKETKDYLLLMPNFVEKYIYKSRLKNVFTKIYDDFFIKSDSHEAKRYLEIIKETTVLNYKITTIKQMLAFYYYNKTTQKMRLDFIESLQKHYSIYIDSNEPFINEVERVLTIEIGVLKNELTFLELEYKEMIKQSISKDFDYYDRIGALSEVLPNNSLLKEEMTLATYIALEKNAKKKIEKQNKP